MKDINLFEGIKKSAPPKKTSKAVSAGLVILILVAVALGGLYCWIKYINKNLDANIDSINQRIESMGGSENLDTENNMLLAYQSYNQMLKSLSHEIQIYPKLDASLFADLASKMPYDTVAQSVSYEGGVLTLTCLSDSADSPAIFVGALKESSYINTVNYKRSGFYTQENTDTPEDDATAETTDKETAGTETAATENTEKIQFIVECYLKGGSAE